MITTKARLVTGVYAKACDYRAAFRENSYRPIKDFNLEPYNNSSDPFWNSLLSKVEEIPQGEVKEELKKFYHSLQDNFIQVIKEFGKEPDFIEQSKFHISTMKDFDQVMKVIEEHFSPESVEKWRIAMERLFESFYGWAGHSLMIPDGENVYRPIAGAGVMYHSLHFVSFDRNRVPEDLWNDLVTYTHRFPDYKNYWLNRINLLPTPETTAVTPWPIVNEAIRFMVPFQWDIPYDDIVQAGFEWGEFSGTMHKKGWAKSSFSGLRLTVVLDDATKKAMLEVFGEKILPLLEAVPKEPGRLLDLGCGGLLPMFDFIDEGFNGTIEAHDYSLEMVKRAEINRDVYLSKSGERKRIQIFENDITTEKFQKSVESRIRSSGKFNKITMIDVIQDLPQTTVKSTLEWVIKKALAEGGKLFISILLERDREFYVREVEEVLNSLKVSHGLTIEKKEWNPGDRAFRFGLDKPYIFTEKRVTFTISRFKSSELKPNDSNKLLNDSGRNIDRDL